MGYSKIEISDWFLLAWLSTYVLLKLWSIMRNEKYISECALYYNVSDMKQIRIILSEKEYNKLKRVKGKKTWRETLLALAEKK